MNEPVDLAAIRALYGDSDYVTVSVYGVEMLLQDHEHLRARIVALEHDLGRANVLGNSMTMGLGRAADERDEALARIDAALAHWDDCRCGWGGECSCAGEAMDMLRLPGNADD